MKTMAPVLGTLVLGAVLGVSAGAVAAQLVTVAQKGRTFSVKELTIAEGDTVQFVNDDGELMHHVFANGPDLSFDSGEMKPGARYAVRFARKGTVRVRCEIHPRMVMAVTVE